MNHIIYYKHGAVCPRCGGLLRKKKSDIIILNCMDCGLFLRVVGDGTADAEIEFEEVTIGE